MGEIKGCPFCGRKATLKHSKEYPDIWRCGCSKCDFFFHKKGAKEAIKAWNKRYDKELEPLFLNQYGFQSYFCPKCRSSLGSGIHYCATCGAHIKYFGG